MQRRRPTCRLPGRGSGTGTGTGGGSGSGGSGCRGGGGGGGGFACDGRCVALGHQRVLCRGELRGTE
eukprot:scaffold108891_cov54-Phaeocystis_antarctica.AAC.1